MYQTRYFQANTENELLKLITTIFITSHDGLAICDANGYVLLYNEAYLHITGISADILDRFNMFQQVEMKLVPESSGVKAIRTKQMQTAIIDYPNGRRAINTATPVLDQDGNVQFVVGNVRDITELNLLQRELEETRQINTAFQRALEQIQNGMTADEQLIYRSGAMHKIVSLVKRFSTNDSPLLLLGESGVGKDVLATYIHQESKRPGQLIKINCGAIPDHLLESELFGYEKGAFTGATQAKEGLLELAHEGTIFLDEIGDLPYPLQVKLLNVLQDGKVRRLGGKEARQVNMRIIAATNRDLEAMVAEKKFRQDLFYRLNVLSISIPPLRERREDIPALVFYFLKRLEQKYKVETRIDAGALEALMEYDWPGNIRELKNVVERAYHMSEDGKITLEQLPSSILAAKKRSRVLPFAAPDKPVSLKEAVERFEQEYIAHVLTQSETLQECADKLGVHLSTLVRKKRQLGIR